MDVLVHHERVSTSYFVVLSVTWSQTDILDAAHNRAPYVHVIGSGKAWVMRDGKLVAGRWVRPSYRSPVKLLDASGQVIALAPGRTWMELQPRPYHPAFR